MGSNRSLRSASVVAVVTATAYLAAAATGTALRAAPVNEALPTISGKPRVGQSLSATQGQWQGEPTAFFYQWLRCDETGGNCAAVAGATQPTYALTSADVGSRMRVEVVAQNADGASPATRSSATRAIRIAVPTLVSKPTIAGSAREGETLTASPGQWNASPTSFAFAWKRCVAGSCATVPGATAATYALSALDVGARMRVRVVASNAGGKSQAASSTSTATVVSAFSGFSLGKPKRDTRLGLARFRVLVPGPGVLTLARTSKVKGEQRTVAAARTVKLTVKPRGQAKTRLRRRGKTRVRAFVTFAFDGGASQTKAPRVTLKRGR